MARCSIQTFYVLPVYQYLSSLLQLFSWRPWQSWAQRCSTNREFPQTSGAFGTTLGPGTTHNGHQSFFKKCLNLFVPEVERNGSTTFGRLPGSFHSVCKSQDGHLGKLFEWRKQQDHDRPYECGQSPGRIIYEKLFVNHVHEIICGVCLQIKACPREQKQ